MPLKKQQLSCSCIFKKVRFSYCFCEKKNMWELGLLGGWFKNKNKNNTKLKSRHGSSSKTNCSGPVSFQLSIWKTYVELPFGSPDAAMLLLSCLHLWVLSVVSRLALPLHKPLAWPILLGTILTSILSFSPAAQAAESKPCGGQLTRGLRPGFAAFTLSRVRLHPLPFRPGMLSA